MRILVEYASSGRVPNCVNSARRTPATHLLIVRHLRVGALAHVFGRIHVDQEPAAATLEAIRAGSDDILELSVVALG